MLYLFVSLLLSSTLFVFPEAHANESNDQKAVSSNVESLSDQQKELKMIDDEIELVEAHLDYYRKKAMNAETSAQTYFRFRQDTFVEKEEEFEDAEKQVISLKTRLESLQNRKQQLLGAPSL